LHSVEHFESHLLRNGLYLQHTSPDVSATHHCPMYLQHTATAATHCNTYRLMYLQRTSTHIDVSTTHDRLMYLQHTSPHVPATHCNTYRCICNALQHISPLLPRHRASFYRRMYITRCVGETFPKKPALISCLGDATSESLFLSSYVHDS